MTTISVPGGIDFAGFYYPEILRALLEDMRIRREELGLTDENDLEVHIQFMRAFAFVGHLNNTRLDTVATELLLGSATLLESVKRLMRLIGVELASASPGVADILLELSEVTTSDTTGFVPELAEWATDSVPAISYECLQEGGYDLDRTDQVSHVFGLEKEKSGTAGFVTTTSPDLFNRSGGDDTFASGDVGNHLFIPSGISDNGGEFRIIEYISADQVRVVRVPGSISPGFQDESGLTWSMSAFTSDYATEANTPSSTFDPWTDVVAGDMLFIGHDSILVNQLDFDIDTVAANITGVWEYFDDTHSSFPPTTVTDLSGSIRFNVNSLLGTVDRSGAIVTVEHLSTGTIEKVESVWSSGENRITTSTTLGQVTVSEDQDDYLVTADWVPFPDQDDNTSDLSVSAEVSWELPQDEDRNWQPTEVNLVESNWARYRVISVSTPTEPTIDEIDLDQGDQFMVVVATQGETIGPQVLGSSDGGANQEFQLPDTPYLDDTVAMEIDESGGGSWTTYVQVLNFLNSTATSRHFRLEKDAQDKATAIFGDGVNGKIPPSGTDNIRATYRVGGDVNGNVGPTEISVNADGVSGISSVTNPRAAIDWRMKDGGTEADIERVKRDKPAELRTRSTAANPGDVLSLAVNEFTDRNGAKPVARAWAVEEGLGIKTVKLLVVGSGGRTLTAQEREDLEEYFNGDRNARPITYGTITLNQRVYVFNYEPVTVGVRAMVLWPGGNSSSIRVALLNLITPLAVEEDGVTYVFDFGGYVSLSRIYSEIHAVDPAIEDVPVLELDGGGGFAAASVTLGTNELPITTSTSIELNIQG